MSEKSSNASRIPTLDGLRAAAIVIVIVSHAWHDNKVLSDLGHMGVLIFFSLSGYLITARLLVEYRSTGCISLRDFYLRRVFRILPPGLVYLGILSVLSALGIAVCGAPIIRSAIFFYTNYIDVGKGWYAGHFWSLSVEEHFYLFWPCLLLIFGVMRGWRTAVCLALAISLWRVADYHQHILAQLIHDPFLQWLEFRTDLIADTLLWGCCLAFLKLKSAPFVSTVVAACSACLLALLCAKIRLPFLPHNIGFLMPIEHLLPAILVGAVVSCPDAPVGRLLEFSLVRYIGHLSYSLYIWQELFLWGPNGPRMAALLGIAATVVCAYLSYRFVEQPCIGFGRQFITRRSLVAAADTG